MTTIDIFENCPEIDLFHNMTTAEKLQSEILSQIAICIHNKRLEMDMTQEEFAKLNNVRQSVVSKWESGDHNFSIETLCKVFATIGLTLSVEELETPENAMNPKSIKAQNDRIWTTSSSSYHNAWGRTFGNTPAYNV